jgi:hypothetical protein
MWKNKDFLVTIPNFNPVSQAYERTQWWLEQIRYCIEGKWVEGKWMPGVLYFYVNFWPIEIGSQGNKGKSIGRPWLRDIDWDKAYWYMEARGFSGFTNDPHNTCNELVGPLRDDKYQEFNIKNLILREEDVNKKYVIPREYLFKEHTDNYGKPLFQNEAWNIIDLEAREGGKSFFAAACIAHNFLFDGAYDFDLWLQKRKSAEPMVSQTVVGAIESQFSNDLLKKFRLGFENLPGSVEYKGIKYPSPLWVETRGSLAASKTLESIRSSSKIIHRTFQDNPLAANGTRPSLALIEEVGFCDNIEEVLGALKECVSQSGRQFGTVWMFGTGGLTKGIAANYTKHIFYNPKEFRCLEFEDVYEYKGSIGLFVPKNRVLNQFKDLETNTSDNEAALDYLIKSRKNVENNKVKYATEVINNPIKPSEIFFSMDGLFFPTTDLKFALNALEINTKLLNSSYKGFVVPDEGKMVWKNTNDKTIREYPHRINKGTQGCIEIFEHPVENDNGEVPDGIYIAGCDPVDDDGLLGSLQSTFIINRLTRRIVAEYTARHETVKEYYENLRRLLIYYNAKCNYENAKKGLFQYFENKNSTHLLCPTPKILKDMNVMSKAQLKGNKAYGTPASESVNNWHRNLTKEWLLETAFNEEDINNCYFIRSTALLQELLYWNPEGNFDRVSAMGMAMILLEEKAKRPIMIEQETNTSLRRFENFINANSILNNDKQRISETKTFF